MEKRDSEKKRIIRIRREGRRRREGAESKGESHSGGGGRGRELRWFGIESERGVGSRSEDRRVSQNREDSEGKGEFIREMEGWEVFRSIWV